MMERGITPIEAVKGGETKLVKGSCSSVRSDSAKIYLAHRIVNTTFIPWQDYNQRTFKKRSLGLVVNLPH